MAVRADRADHAPPGSRAGLSNASRALGWSLALGLVPFLLLTWRFDFLADDAFISFRYARNLVRGHGLVYNPGVDPPIEGYSELLWVLFLAAWMKVGAQPEVVARVVPAACGVLLVCATIVHASRRVSTSPLAGAGTALYVGTLTPLAVWSTGGLGTMPFALASFVMYVALLGRPERPSGPAAGLAGAAAVLLRADGVITVTLLVSVAILIARLRRDPCLRKAALAAAMLAGLALVGQMVFRVWTYDDWLPRTARAKVDMSAFTLARGARYVAGFLVTMPSVAVAVAAPLFFGRRCLYRPTVVSLVVFAVTCAYAVTVGGDFMCFGRFLVPALPFTALLLGRALVALEEDGRPRAVAGLAAGLAALSLLPAFGVEPAPKPLREILNFRHNRYSDEALRRELEQWRLMKDQAANWSLLGRALALHTEPGDSIVLGAVGAAGYYSDLFVYDRYGLVTGGVEGRDDPERRKSAGHDQAVTRSHFLKESPTYLGAYLNDGTVTHPPYSLRHERETIPLDPADGFPAGMRLVLVRPSDEPREVNRPRARGRER